MWSVKCKRNEQPPPSDSRRQRSSSSHQQEERGQMGFYTSEIFEHTNYNVCVGGGRLPLQAVSTKHSNSRTKYHRLGRTHAKHKEPHSCVTRSAPTPPATPRLFYTTSAGCSKDEQRRKSRSGRACRHGNQGRECTDGCGRCV